MALVAVHNALDNGLILAFGHHLVPVVHHLVAGLGGAGQQHQARGVAVEAMHHMGCALLVRALEIVVKH